MQITIRHASVPSSYPLRLVLSSAWAARLVAWLLRRYCTNYTVEKG